MGLYLIGELPWWLVPENLISLAIAAFGLGMVIFVHELGHFLVAKACGVKCEKFYVGFDVPLGIGPLRLPSTLWKHRWGETEYGIGIIPLGGYVKMLGQDDNPSQAAAEAERIRVAQESSADGAQYALDPRSYPAKSVPQRMAIISAGVIMNLIFAVLFAATAYVMGVRYEPAVVGATLPGDSAWQAGLQPGDRMLQIGRDGRRDDQLRFRDLQYNVMKSGEEAPLELLIQREGQGEVWLSVQPRSRKEERQGLATIGVISPSTNRVYLPDYKDGSPASESPLQAGDMVETLLVGDRTFTATDAMTIRRVMYQFPDVPLTLQVRRHEDPKDASSPAREMEVTLAPQPVRDLGLRMEMGPIVAVQDGSPAAEAGFQSGDILESIDGQPIDDPLRVDARLLPHVGSPVTVELLRSGRDERITLSVTPRPIEMWGEAGRQGGPVSAETLGVAFTVRDRVAAVVPGSPAETAGIGPGDHITSLLFVPSDGGITDADTYRKLSLHEPIEFAPDRDDWAWADAVLQGVPADLQVQLTVDSQGKTRSVTLTPVASPRDFHPRRGLILDRLTETRRAGSWGDAFRLGIRETVEGVQQVVVTLQRLPKLFRHLGGPGTIAYAATAEASEGVPRLLIFLTLLSANLAVLNFLPIPVLDGGHMMFLIYEAIFGKPMNDRIAFFATMAGLCLILGLMVFVIGMDVYRFSGMGG